MLDFHTHLAPAADDGSRNAQESLELISELETLGFDSIVLTPHFYPSNETLQEFVERRKASYEELEPHLADKKTYLGCECYLHDYLFHAEDISPLLLEGTKLLLVELSYDKRAGRTMLELVSKLVRTYDVIPVLAHIERYPYIMKDESLFEEFMRLGCRAQVNLTSFSEFFIKNRLAHYLQNGYINYLGTDTHRLPFNRTACKKATAFLEKNFGANWKDRFADEI